MEITAPTALLLTAMIDYVETYLLQLTMIPHVQTCLLMPPLLLHVLQTCLIPTLLVKIAMLITDRMLPIGVLEVVIGGISMLVNNAAVAPVAEPQQL